MDEIYSVSDYIAVLKRYTENAGGKDRRFYYRGEPKLYSTAGQPGIVRNDCRKHEFEIFQECGRRLPDEFSDCSSNFERLVKMQHYGIPTRLLDISLDPLSGLFFALYQDPRDKEPHDDDDGVVLVYEVPKDSIKNGHSDSVSVLSCIAAYHLDDLNIRNLDADEANDREGFNKSTQMQYLLHEIQTERPAFKPWILKDTLESVLCVHPLLNNPRIRAQQGAFLLYGIDGDKLHLAKLENSDIRVRKIRVPAVARTDLKKEMRLLARTIDTVYPDWDGVADFVKRFLFNKEE